MDWLEGSFGPRIITREIGRWLTALEDDLEEVVLAPWSFLYGSHVDPSEDRDADSDYHYFDQAAMAVGWSDRYDALWRRYLVLWKEFNAAERLE